MPNLHRLRTASAAPAALLHVLALLAYYCLASCCITCTPCSAIDLNYPDRIVLRAGVLLAPPFAMLDNDGGSVNNQSSYTGFQIDLLDRLQTFARSDGVTLDFVLSPSPAQYGNALDLVANDCTSLPSAEGEGGELNSVSDCTKFDLIVGDYYCNPDRSVRVDFTPAWLRTTMATVKHIGHGTGTGTGTAECEATGCGGAQTTTTRTYETMSQLEGAGGSACVPQGAYLSKVAMAKFPGVNYTNTQCPHPLDCIRWLKAGRCDLYVDDELLLRYRALTDPTLEINRESFNTQYLVWPLRTDLDPTVTLLLKRWMYAAIANATLDELYYQYFAVRSCPIGKAGPECDRYCDPRHGTSDREGNCICSSTKWTGEDCSVEVMEDVNLIPHGLKITGYVMFATAAAAVVGCAIWLGVKRKTRQVASHQPFFLSLVLLGCLISSSTILTLAQEDAGYGSVPACMVSPWLYSVGFCITFGTLLAKMRRIEKLFRGAAQMRRTKVTVRETLCLVGCVLAVDCVVLVVWTAVDPLQWTRQVLLTDQYGEPLASQGYCSSDHWGIFVGIIATLHFTLLFIGCYFSYRTRAVPTQFSEAKYVSLAIISNFQVFLIGLPVLVIVGLDSDSSFFVRSAIIWINNMAVIGLIFGHIIYSVRVGARDISTRSAIKSFIDKSAHRDSNVSAYEPSRRASSMEHEPVEYDRTTDLITAAAKGDLDKVRGLLREKVVGFSTSGTGGKGSSEVEIDSPVHINDGDYDKRTAIHLAAGEGHDHVVEELCSRGADVNAEDRWGGRPLDDALRHHHVDCATILLRYGARPGRMYNEESARADCNASADVGGRDAPCSVEDGVTVERYSSDDWRSMYNKEEGEDGSSPIDIERDTCKTVSLSNPPQVEDEEDSATSGT